MREIYTNRWRTFYFGYKKVSDDRLSGSISSNVNDIHEALNIALTEMQGTSFELKSMVPLTGSYYEILEYMNSSGIVSSTWGAVAANTGTYTTGVMFWFQKRTVFTDEEYKIHVVEENTKALATKRDALASAEVQLEKADVAIIKNGTIFVKYVYAGQEYGTIYEAEAVKKDAVSTLRTKIAELNSEIARLSGMLTD